LLAVLTAVALWPRRFHVSQRPAVLVAWIEEHQASPADVERDLALWLGEKYDDNRHQPKPLPRPSRPKNY